MKKKVDYEFIRAWVKDLETTRAPQVTGYLCLKEGSRYGYCCLGRAEVINETTSVKQADGKNFIDANGEEQTVKLTSQTAKLIGGVADPSLRIPKALREKASGTTYTEASTLNDDHEFTFKEIAQCIRATWPKAFK